MNTLARLLRLVALAALLVAAQAFATDETLAHARRAQDLLGADVWSRVIRIENDRPSARHPRVVHALVFEVAGILWFYYSPEGTQSFSLHRGRLAEEKGNFAPLLRDINPGFARWQTVADTSALPAAAEPLPNGCFIRSVVALRERLLAGGEVVRPQLLSYYIETKSGMNGHTVLAYEADGRVEVIDATRTDGRFSLPATLAKDALKLARAVDGQKVAAARLVPLAPTVSLGLYTHAAGATDGDVASSG